MSSPFPLPTLSYPQTSSPFPLPSPFPLAPSPLASLPIFAQSPIPNLGLSQGIPGTPSIPPPQANAAGFIISTSNRPGAPSSEVEIDTALRGIEEVLGLLGRLEVVLKNIQAERDAVFSISQDAGEDKHIGGGMGSPARIMALQQEYAQILLSLQPLLTSSLIGALPVPLSSALPQPPDPANNRSPTISELTIWTENRAELEFSRREGIKAGAKAVLDVFKTR